ncbi:QRFP-like peptide receptor [Exaiptasia diaphana]|uniref:G-protein coupled receptors family 1 profile domain-containing protein n=1 Tax=Exaiptasia diaphana TaxID=2652724 RepID=A0A913XUK6_EXADI|nr:QRFP-like peptide receptor [Exaiptasia diaphana]KXJ20063.1 Neuropeptide FF receptor 2 [Exaiptasia diaphana]
MAIEDMINSTVPSNMTGVEDVDSAAVRACKVLAYCLIILMSLIGNSLVITVIYKDKRMKTNINRFIVNMCISDILMTLWVLPQTISSIVHDGRWQVTGDMGDFLCKMVPLWQDVSAGVSIFSMTVIAFDRFFAIVLPFKAHVITTRRCYLMIFLTWFLSVIIHTPYLFTLRLYQFDEDNIQCRQIWPIDLMEKNIPTIFYLLQFSMLYAVPLLSIAFFYTAVILELNRKSKTENQNITQQRARQRENREVSFMLITVVVLFALSWAPLNTMAFLHFFKWEKEGVSPSYGRTLRFVADFLIHSNSAQNAVIYFTFNSRFKQGLRKICCCPSGRDHQDNDISNGYSSMRSKRWYIKRDCDTNVDRVELTSRTGNGVI